MEQLNKIVGYGLTSAIGSHVAEKIVKSSSTLGGHVFSLIGGAATAVLPSGVTSRISAVSHFAFSKLASLSDATQAPLNKIQRKQNNYIYTIEDVDQQQKYAAIFRIINRTIIAPIIEEALYRGPQIVVGLAIEKLTGLDTVSSQLLVAAVTNTLFGLAHTGGQSAMKRLRSQEFLHAFTKGAVLAVTAALASQKGSDAAISEIANRCLSAASGLGAAVIGHALSNLPGGIKQLKRDLNQ